MKKKIVWLAILASGLSGSVMAQHEEKEYDAGWWTNVSIAPKPVNGKWKTLYSLEFRSKDYIREVDLFCGMINLDYVVNEHVQIGAGYELFLNKKSGGGYYPEYRYYPEAIFSYALGRFSAALRSRVMNTYTEWRHPNFDHRNRFKVNYSIKETPLKPFVYVEPYHAIDNCSYRFSKIRYAAGCAYKQGHHQFDLYYLQEDYHLRPFTRHVLEIDYNYSF
ncbi:MAG: DUF2490 domain-containing protein [Tannerella sp.]|jgi:hypothetical protein|nr:DUF2490 domain-containing protein [Tannerella sp.]